MPELPDEDSSRLSPLGHWPVAQGLSPQGRGGQARSALAEAPSAAPPVDIWRLYPETLAAIYGDRAAAATRVGGAGSPGDEVAYSALKDAAPGGGFGPGPGDGRGDGDRRAHAGAVARAAAAALTGAGIKNPPVAFVRRGPPAGPTRSAPAPQPAVQGVQSALLRQEQAGGMAFDIELDDAVLGAMTLTIAVHEGRATARLEVADVNARRLVDAEQGRLHDALRQRGFKVDAIEVTVRAASV